MIKGYPKTRFEIIDETGIQEIPVNAVSSPLPLAMQVYTSDKGPENWHVITSLEAFSKENGNISFVKHGQAQLTVAEVLRAGGAVLGKRMVAPSANLANVTIRARVIKVNTGTTGTGTTGTGTGTTGTDTTGTTGTGTTGTGTTGTGTTGTDTTGTGTTGTDTTGTGTTGTDTTGTTGTGTTGTDTTGTGTTGTGTGTTGTDTKNGTDVALVYFYAKTFDGVKTFEDACAEAQSYVPGEETGDTIPAIATNGKEIDVPLFTVTPMGRGKSNLYFTIRPEYVTSKSSRYITYSFIVRENNEDVESTLFTMNPDIIVDGVSQALNPKVKARSTQIKVNMYEDELYKFMKFITGTATENGEVINIGNLINYDIIRGLDKKGKTQIGGIVTFSTADNPTNITTQSYNNLWDDNAPSGLKPIDITDEIIGVYLDGGTWGQSSFNKDASTGKYPDLTEATILDRKEYNRQVRAVFGGEPDTKYNKYLFDTVIYDLDANYVDFMCDFGLDNETKNVIIDLANFRGDFMFFADLGLNGLSNITEITDAINGKTVPQGNSTKVEIVPLNKSRYSAVYHNTCRIYDPYTAKQIKVTLPLLLAKKIVSHVASGVGRPFAGILNNITFPEIIDGSINFLPVAMPGIDQKQQLVDLNINYISKYTQLPVMETMYVNVDTYSQLSYVHNIMAVQEIIKIIRSRCPSVRYTFMDGSDLQRYIDDGNAILNQYSTYFSSISMTYMADEKYERNNIFYAVIRVRFKNFIQEEFFKIIAID